jgi:uncharacterized membrane protein
MKIQDKIGIKEFSIISLFIIAYFLIGTITSLNYLFSYTYGKSDTAVWIQQLWCITNQKVPFETLYFQNQIYQVHFTPMAYVYSFAFNFNNRLLLLIIVEAFSYSIAFLPLYLLAYSITESKLFSFILSAVPLFSYLGISQHFYFETLLFPYLCSALFFTHIKKYFLATIFFVFTLGFREYMALPWLFFAIINVLRDRKNKFPYIWICLSLSWVLFYLFFIDKHVGLMHFRYLGEDKQQVITNFFTAPAIWLSSIINLKSFAYFLILLIPMAFISLAGFEILLPILPVVFINLLGKVEMNNFSHYTIIIVPFVIYSALVGFSRIRNYLKIRSTKLNWVVSLSLISFIIFYNLFNVRHFAYKFKESLILKHALQGHASDIRNMFDLIPQRSSIAVADNLTPYFAEREKIYNINTINTYEEKIRPDFVLFDFLYSDEKLYRKILSRGFGVLRESSSNYYNSNILEKKYDESMLRNEFITLDEYILLKKKGSLVLYKLKN